MILNRIFHKHEWETFESHTLNVYNSFVFTTDKPSGFRYVELQRCKTCGKIRKQVINY